MTERLLLIDGSNYLYRAYHALPPLSNPQGEETGAIFGFVSMFKMLCTTYPCTYVAIIFDPKGPTRRHSIYTPYKAHRGPMPESLQSQVPRLYQLLTQLGYPPLIQDGEEADDVIGTLCQQGRAQGLSVLIATGDKDMAQLVDDHVTLVNTMTKKTMTPAKVEEKFGVKPSQIIDYLALMGDQSDNIPGIPKVGPKTAAKWLNQYGDIDTLITQADDIKGKVGESLRAHMDQLALAKQLTRIDTQLDLPYTIEQLQAKPEQKEALRTSYAQLGFQRWLKALAPPPAQSQANDYGCLLTQADWQKHYQALCQAKSFAFDLETTSLDCQTAHIVGIALATQDWAIYLPLAHRDCQTELSLDHILRDLTPLFQGHTPIIGHHLKYDLGVLARYGIRVTAPLWDTLLMSHMLFGQSHRHNLDELAQRYLHFDTLSFQTVLGDASHFGEVPADKACQYAAEDADISFKLAMLFQEKLTEQPKVKQALETLEYPLVPLLVAMEHHGVKIDCDTLHAQHQMISERLAELIHEAHTMAGAPFNLASPKQVRQILFEQLALPVLKKTPSGEAATSEEALMQLRHHHPLVDCLLNYRHLHKLDSTYLRPLPAACHPDTQRLHTSFNQAVTSTGRLSSERPNLQNIPMKREEGQRIRQAFVAPDDHVLIAADYSQIELRLMAHFAQDEQLVHAFQEDLDVHCQTASDLFDTPLDAITREQRRHAKTINFGLMYGMSSFGLAKQLNTDRHTAQAYIDAYFARYPGVQRYRQSMQDLAHAQGYVETLGGRRIYLPAIRSQHAGQRKAAERAAINGPLQGSAADLIKAAMIKLAPLLQNSGSHMILQVHDELVFETPEQAQATFIEGLRQAMTQAWSLHVPLVVDIHAGKTWYDAHPM